MARKKSPVETPAPEAPASAPPSSPETHADDAPVQVKTHPRLEERNNYVEQLAARAEAEILEASPPEEPPVEDPPAAPVEEPPAAAKTRKIKVDGTEQEVPEDKVVEAGIRALQKESAADRRLQEATEKLTRAEQLLATAEKRSAAPDDTESPPSGSPDADVAALAKAIQFGTEDEVKAAVKTMLDRQAPGRSDATPKPEEVVAVVEQRLEFKSALNKFQTEFKDVWDDPYLRKLAFDEDDRLQKEIIAGNREPMNYLERFAEAGKAVREWRDRIAGSAGAPKVDIGADKRDRKAAAGSLPTAGGRAAPPPAPAAPSNPTDIVREMRQARGQI